MIHLREEEHESNDRTNIEASRGVGSSRDARKLKVAIRYGADAVYIGGNAYGLRSRAGNFTPEEMAEGVAFAREHNAKVYVAANMVTHEGNQEGQERFSENCETSEFQL